MILQTTLKLTFSLVTVVLILLGGRSVLTAQEAIPSNTTFKLERTDCFLTCEAYVVTISAQGLVTFEGKKNVRFIGTAHSHISPSRLQDLIGAFAKAKYFSMRDHYLYNADGCRVYDGDTSSAITSVVIGTRSKSITRYNGCFPKNKATKGAVSALGELELLIDQAANTEQWIK